jgi:hypothetical protein
VLQVILHSRSVQDENYSILHVKLMGVFHAARDAHNLMMIQCVCEVFMPKYSVLSLCIDPESSHS